MPCALVLSAGGMFGAYQAGVWKALAERFQPDLVVGASAGALNAWAIAGGCTGAALTTSGAIPPATSCACAFPRFLCGVFDPAPLYRQVDQMFARFQPRIPSPSPWWRFRACASLTSPGSA